MKSESAERRAALVTGGNRGIGLETCRQLAKLGMKVHLGSRDEAAGKEAAETLKKEGLDVWPQQLDVADPKSIDACAKRLKRVDVLVNNAGVYPQGTALDCAEKDVRDAMEVHFFGPMLLCRAFVPRMIQEGYGRVVNVTSGYGLFSEGLQGPAPYSLSKAALDALTFKVSQELRGDVKVNAVCPGWVRTRMGGAPATRSPEKGAETVVWLATLPEDGPNGGVFRDKKKLAW